MKTQSYALFCCIALLLGSWTAACAEDKAVVSFNADTNTSQFKTDHASVKVVKTDDGYGLEMTIDANADYPGVHLLNGGKKFDASGHQGIEAVITNTSDAKQSICVRVDNPGDWRKNPWNAEILHGVAPGKTVTIRVTFGQSWGHPGYKLDSSKISNILVYTSKSSAPRTLVIHSVKTFGTAEAKPADAAADNGNEPSATQVKGKTLIDVTAKQPDAQIDPTSGQISYTTAADGMTISIDAGSEGYPGLKLKPKGAEVWDLSAYGHIDAKITNTGDKGLTVAMRVDNPGDWKKSPWNTEQTYVKPGQTRTIHLIFGFQYGHKPGYKLKADKISQVMLFTTKVKNPVKFRIDSLEVGGPASEAPPVDPASIRIEPKDGYLFGSDIAFNADKQLKAENGAEATLDGSVVNATFAKGKDNGRVELQPAKGRWDLRRSTDVRVTVKNTGDVAVSPRAIVTSNGSGTDWAGVDQPIAPGGTAQIVIPFAPATYWQGIPDASKTHYDRQKGTGTDFRSDAVKGVIVRVDKSGGKLQIQSVTAPVTPADLPQWLGQRPPVEGEWVQTFDEEFNDNTVDESKWNIYGENFWDKKSHFSKENVIISDGVARLRFSKKYGHQNDAPNHQRATEYATGFLDTYGKWTQTYGYFEARMKLPTAPGLWPAFWMMPDRGVDAGPQWKRADTAKGGMEFDIMEHLTRWGPYRYNVAMHWDGYQKNHKSTGSSAIYVQPDKDGFITAGLLWLPGKLTFYCNGQIVGSWETERVSHVPADIMFTLPCGGWDNSPLNDAKLPDDFVIDYVRCWQRKDLMPAAPAADKAAPADNAAD